MSTEPNLIIGYVNHKSEFSIREIIPANITFAYGNLYHQDSWLLPSVDVEKGQFRDFSFEGLLKGMVVHTLKSLGECVTDSKVDGIMNKLIIGQNYK